MSNIKFIEPQVYKLEQPKTYVEALQLSELAGRNSHRSEGSMTEDSYASFLSRMRGMKHFSVLELAPMYFTIKYSDLADTPTLRHLVDYLTPNHYSRVVFDNYEGAYYITTNLRVLTESGFDKDLDLSSLWTPPTYKHVLRNMFEVHTNIAIAKEINRHRTLSLIESSTRYINFTKDKFEDSLPICLNSHFLRDMKELGYDENNVIEECSADLLIFTKAYRDAYQRYKDLITVGYKAQDARAVLPLDTYTKVYYSAYVEDWKHFLGLRLPANAHPDVRIIANLIKDLL